MQYLNSTEYYRGRERQERALADRAVNPAIAAIHRDMAQRYTELVTEAAENERRQSRKKGSSASSFGESQVKSKRI